MEGKGEVYGEWGVRVKGEGGVYNKGVNETRGWNWGEEIFTQ